MKNLFHSKIFVDSKDKVTVFLQHEKKKTQMFQELAPNLYVREMQE